MKERVPLKLAHTFRKFLMGREKFTLATIYVNLTNAFDNPEVNEELVKLAQLTKEGTSKGKIIVAHAIAEFGAKSGKQIVLPGQRAYEKFGIRPMDRELFGRTSKVSRMSED
ncbi:unnamed protein product [Nippostrongylus brasiliensis]|uniref:Costars domain-containing protein n=1 Tax=Nippostrongylus brasiliensis TaxID=27835 RepID=A0A0N4XJ14_NIPBR|nr:unnamed protein product [Nippostrongylus brasiliensis]